MVVVAAAGCAVVGDEPAKFESDAGASTSAAWALLSHDDITPPPVGWAAAAAGAVEVVVELVGGAG